MVAHVHSGAASGPAKSSPIGRAILLTLLGLTAVATIVGLILLWPNGAKVEAVRSSIDFVVPEATFESGAIAALSDGCAGQQQVEELSSPGTAAMTVCQTAEVTILSGPNAGQTTEVTLGGTSANAGIAVGDHVRLLSLPNGLFTFDGSASDGSVRETYFGVDRGVSLLWLAIAFVVLVVLVAWLRGLLALVGLAFSGMTILVFMLPSIVGGSPGAPVALVTASAILFVVLYLAHGPSIRTSTALAGTLCGIAITALVAQLSVGAVRLSGFTDEAAGVLSGVSSGLDFRGLLTGAIIIAGLGVLNDVTITQSSSVWELRAAGPGLSRRALFGSAMRIGRDHIASTIYTIVFAYVGTSLSVLLLLYLYDLPVIELLTFEDLAAEIVTTLCSAIGVVLAVPITTLIAVLLVSPATRAGRDAAVRAEAPSPERPRRRRSVDQPAQVDEVWRPLDWEF